MWNTGKRNWSKRGKETRLRLLCCESVLKKNVIQGKTGLKTTKTLKDEKARKSKREKKRNWEKWKKTHLQINADKRRKRKIKKLENHKEKKKTFVPIRRKGERREKNREQGVDNSINKISGCNKDKREKNEIKKNRKECKERWRERKYHSFQWGAETRSKKTHQKKIKTHTQHSLRRRAMQGESRRKSLGVSPHWCHHCKGSRGVATTCVKEYACQP